jgi:hypothetical protein
VAIAAIFLKKKKIRERDKEGVTMRGEQERIEKEEVID